MKKRIYGACTAALVAMGVAMPLAALAQTTTTTTSTTTTTTASTDDKSVSTQANMSTSGLVSKYTTLAGSTSNSTSLIDGLRNGTAVTLTAKDGTKTTFTPPTGKMGNGEINIALSLAEKLMAKDSTLTLQSALTGTNGVLTMRASGEGWGQIANSLGYKVGDLVRSSKATAAQDTTKRPDRSSHTARAESGRPDRIDHDMRPQRPDLPDRAMGRPGR